MSHARSDVAILDLEAATTEIEILKASIEEEKLKEIRVNCCN